jgi:glycosyltransferase involved in cell wall biosynthesis
LDIGWGIKHLRKQINNLELLVSDCEFIKNKDENIFGVNSAKHHVVYAQCDCTNNIRHSDKKPNKRLLWSSRICKQKRPELLLVILKELLKTFPDVLVDVYGDADADHKNITNTKDNLRYQGVYDNFSELEVNKYDAFIYTSVFDGLPNIVLEALGAGLPVIAPNVGGVSEAVIDGKTGFLIDDHVDDIIMAQSYLNSLEKLYKNWSSWIDMSRNAKTLIAERHGAASYSASVSKAFKLDKIDE